MNLSTASLGLLGTLALLSTVACPWNAAGNTGCRPVAPAVALPEGLEESSGIAWSLNHPGVLWSHNDGGHYPLLYALDAEGKLLAQVALDGIANRDWEDMATSPCGTESCIYLADTGDNYARWGEIYLHRIVDTDSLPQSPRHVETFTMLLPDGPRDIEALFILPGEEVFLVSKGRHAQQVVYRYPPPLRSNEPVTLQPVQSLSARATPIPSQITGASASQDGSLVVLRSYQAMTFYRMVEGALVPLEGGRVALTTLEEPQGEGVAFGSGGQLALTTEAGNFGGQAALQILECQAIRSP